MGVAGLVLIGLALGFSLVIPPGPMNALIAARSVRSFRAGVATGLGAMSADLVLGVLVYLVHAAVDLSAAVRWVEGAGAVVMGYLAYRVLTADRAPVPPPLASEPRLYSQALAVGLSNPFQVVWWLTAGLAFAYLGGLPLLLGLFGAIAVWVISFPIGLRYGVARWAEFPRAVAIVSGTLLAVFAAYFALLAAGVPL
jgi:threonine/homoserine/homoserine lactone efflux protein